MKRLKTVIRGIIKLAVVFSLAGCASPDYRGVLNRDLVAGAVVPQGESVVFGEVLVNYSAGLAESWINVYDEKSSRKVLLQPVRKFGGPFYWHLPPGRYLALDLETVGLGGYGGSSLRIYGKFSVDSPSQLVYIGRLQIAFDRRGSVLSMMVKDDFDEAVGRIHADRPTVQGPITKNLLQLEKSR